MKTTHWTGENIYKWYDQYGMDIQQLNIKKNKQPD